MACSAVRQSCFLLALLIAAATKPLGADEKPQSSFGTVFLDSKNSIEFRWRIVPVQAQLYLDAELSAPTLGYIGWGLSPNGGMPGADILVMWVDDVTGTAHLQDRYATTNAEPLMDGDDQSSILSFEGKQNSTHTTFRFRRAVNAGCTDPEHDLSIPQSTVARVIWAIGERDPDETGHITYHGNEGGANRGMKALYLFSADEHARYERDRAAALADVTETIDLRPSNVNIPAVDTHYSCLLHKLPEISQTIHVIGFEALVHDSSGGNIVHHYVVYLCERGFTPPPAKGTEFTCFSSHQANNDKARTLDGVAKCLQNVIWAWGIGGNSMYMPEGVGLPFFPEDAGRYVFVETHYDSSQLKEARLHDTSGVRILLTNKLRPTSASHLVLGEPPGGGPFLPGRAHRFTVSAVCSSSCTQNFLPPTGVEMFAVALHAHKFARSMVLRHFRRKNNENGTSIFTEMPIISSDTSYDFNYQSWRRTNVVILPGDELVLECGYNTTSSNSTIFAGWGAQEEMCSAFTYVTPASALSSCVMSNSVEMTLAAIGEEEEETPRWITDFNLKQQQSKQRAKRQPQEHEAAAAASSSWWPTSLLPDPTLFLIKSLFRRNDSKMLEIDLAEQFPMNSKNLVNDANKGSGVVRALVGFKSKMQQFDWQKNYPETIEKLQNAYSHGQ